jgi:hypothetical protein
MLDGRLVACLILCASISACNDTDDLHVGLRTSDYNCSGTALTKANPQAPDPVALTCGGEVGVDTREIRVQILGPTGATNIKGLHFDIVYPRDRFAYVDGSIAMVANNFLTYGGGVCPVAVPRVCTAPAEKVGATCNSDGACNVPGVVTPVVTAIETLDPPQDPSMPDIVQGRLSITIDRVMPADGVRVSLGGAQPVLRFHLQTTSVTRPTDPTLLKFENAAAVDPSDVAIGSVVFNDQILVWVE